MRRIAQRVSEHLDDLDRRGLRRRLAPPAGLDLSSNDYLGLAEHPVLKRGFIEAVEREGCGSTGSRLLRGERRAFAELEKRFAAFKGVPAALYFSSGYAANLGVLGTFLEPGDTVFSDELNHASLIDGMRLGRARRVVFPHRDVAALARLLRERDRGGEAFVVTESLFSMDGDFAPLADYAAVCREEGAALIVDEAHAVGIYGARGAGLIEEVGCGADVFLSIDTAGKALGVGGAFVAGPDWAIEWLTQRARTLIFSTAPPPAVAGALDAALDILDAEPERRSALRERANRLRRRLHEAGLDVAPRGSQIIPLRVGDNEAAVGLARRLQARGYDVRAIRPPTVPPGTARLRISVNVKASEGELDRFAEELFVEWAEMTLPRAAFS